MTRSPSNLLFFRALLMGLGLLLCAQLSAAEFVGKIQLRGLQSAAATTSIGVALFPLEGQSLPRRSARDFTVKVSNLRLSPNYIVANPGDRVRFVNQDQDYFELFSPSADQSFEIPLEPSGRDNQALIGLVQADVMHVFCRIHAGTYGRIDVVDTPLIRVVQPDETFEFRDLQAGRWQLRISAPGTETREIEVLAMTSPPVFSVELESLVLAQAKQGELNQPIGVEQLFPETPGY